MIWVKKNIDFIRYFDILYIDFVVWYWDWLLVISVILEWVRDNAYFSRVLGDFLGWIFWV